MEPSVKHDGRSSASFRKRAIITYQLHVIFSHRASDRPRYLPDVLQATVPSIVKWKVIELPREFEDTNRHSELDAYNRKLNPCIIIFV